MAIQRFNAVGGYSTGITGTDVIDSIGNITGVGATFSGLIRANAGISASGITVGGSIVLQNQEFIRNTTNGRMDFMPAPTGSTQFGMYFNMTSWGFGVEIGTIRSSDGALNSDGNILWNVPLVVGSNVNFAFGNDSHFRFGRTTTGLDTLQSGLYCDGVNNSGAFALVALSDQGISTRSPATAHTTPNFYIYANSTIRNNANDFIRFEHNTINGRIVSGGTSGISLEPGSGVVGISGGITGVSSITFSSGQTVSSVVTSVGGATGSISMSPDTWAGLTSGFDLIPSHWSTISAPINSSPTQNDAYFAPITITSRCKIKSIATQNGASSAGNTGNIIFGIYNSTLYGYPNQRLYSSSSTPLTTGNFGVLRVSGVDTILNPGLYWLAMIFSASAIPVAGLSRIGTRFKVITSTSSSPIGQSAVDALRSPQGSFTLLTGITGPFTNVVGADAPGIFYTAEGI